MNKNNIFIILSLALIIITFLLSFDNLCHYRYGNYISAYDNAAHLASIRGFYKQGVFSWVNYWSYAPATFPLNYPPLFHIIGAMLLSFFPFNFVACFYFWSIYLAVLMIVFLIAKKMTDPIGAFLTILMVISFYNVADKSFGFSPLALSAGFGLLSLSVVKERLFQGWIFLALSVLTHLNGLLFFIGYIFYFLYDRSHRQSLKALLEKPHWKIRVFFFSIIFCFVSIIAGMIIIQRGELVVSLIPSGQIFPMLLRPVTVVFTAFDVRGFLLAALSSAGFLILLKKKEYLWAIPLGVVVLGSLALGGRIKSFNLMIIQLLLIGVLLHFLFLTVQEKTNRFSLSLSLMIFLSLIIVFIPSSRRPYGYILSKSSFINFCMPSWSIYTRASFVSMDDLKAATQLMEKLGDKNDLVYIGGPADNWRNFIFASSGIVPLSLDKEMYSSSPSALALYTDKFINNELPLFWFTQKEPPYGYELQQRFPNGQALFLLAQKARARKLTVNVLR